MKVFVTRKIEDNGLDLLREKFEVEIYEGEGAIPRDTLLDKVKGVDAILSLLTDKIDSEIFKAAGENLKVVANYAVGFDNIDLETAKTRGVAVTNTPGTSKESVAEHTIGLMLALAKRIPEANAFTKAGNYKGWDPNLLVGELLLGKTLGLIGSGRIGTEVGIKAHKAFGMKIMYYDVVKNDELEKETGAVMGELDEVLKAAKFISLHVSLLDSTRHLLSKEKLELIGEDAYLINTARGAVVDEAALVELLRDKKIKGAALDVYEHEPELAPGLAELENVILTPHIASATIEARELMSEIAAKNIIEVLEGRKALNSVF